MCKVYNKKDEKCIKKALKIFDYGDASSLYKLLYSFDLPEFVSPKISKNEQSLGGSGDLVIRLANGNFYKLFNINNKEKFISSAREISITYILSQMTSLNKHLPTIIGMNIYDSKLEVILTPVLGKPLFDIFCRENGVTWNKMKNMTRNILILITTISQKFKKYGYAFQHYDLHPNNIFVDVRTERVSIIDFGLAKVQKISAINSYLLMNNKVEDKFWKRRSSTVSDMMSTCSNNKAYIGIKNFLSYIFESADKTHRVDISFWVHIAIDILEKYKTTEEISVLQKDIKKCQSLADKGEKDNYKILDVCLKAFG